MAARCSVRWLPPLLQLLQVMLGAAAAAPTTAPAAFAPALLPQPPSQPASFDNAPTSAWVEIASLLFGDASALQVYWVQWPSDAANPTTLGHLKVAARLGDACNLPYTLWAVAAGHAAPDEAMQAIRRHLADRLGRSFVVAAPYDEVDGDGHASIRELLQLGVWRSRARYFVVLDTSRLPPSRCCSPTLAGRVSAALWTSKKVTAAVLLASCPWRVAFHWPYGKGGEGQSVVVHPGNVSALDAYVNSNVRNFHDRKWVISVYPSYPTLVEEEGAPGQLGGVDAWVMRAAADYFNFTADIVYPEDKESHGSSQGGRGTGTLGRVMTGQAWISFNSRFVKDYNTNDIEFTYPYTFDELCVMVPPSARIPNYITLFRVFSVEVWLGFLGTFACTVAATACLDAAHGPSRAPSRTWRWPAPSVGLAVYDLLLAGAIGVPYAHAKQVSARLLFGTALLFNVVFMGAFQGLLFKSLTKPQYYPEIDSLTLLAETNMLITSRSQSLDDTFSFPTPRMRRLQGNFRIVPKNWTSATPFGFLIRRNGAFLRQEYKSLHLVDECPRRYMLAYITHSDFPHLHLLNVFLLRCMSAGLMSQWLKRTYDSDPEPRSDDDLVLSLFEVEAAFFVLAIGIVVSGVTFAGELLHRRCCRRRGARPCRRPPAKIPKASHPGRRDIDIDVAMRMRVREARRGVVASRMLLATGKPCDQTRVVYWNVPVGNLAKNAINAEI